MTCLVELLFDVSSLLILALPQIVLLGGFIISILNRCKLPQPTIPTVDYLYYYFWNKKLAQFSTSAASP